LADIARADESARVAKAASEVPWYRRWRTAIPALAAVAAVLVFVAIRRPANQEQRDQLVAMAKNEAPSSAVVAQAPALAPSVPAAAPSAPALVSSELAMNDARRQALMSREAPQMNRAVRAPAPVVAPESPATEPASAPPAKASNEIAMDEAKTKVGLRAETMGAFSSQTAHKQALASGAASMTAQSGAAAPNAPAPRSFSMAERGDFTARSVGGASGGPEVPVTIVSPDRSVTWIVGQNGMVRRRDANSPGLKVQNSGVSTDLVAGSAPSATVCWIVGRSGTIIRTTDGEHWELIAAPSADNLTGVSASSARDAIVTTAGGQSFATSDGGASWHRQ
jgi:hypothetical protein